MPVLMMLMVLGLGGVSAVATKVACESAARDAALAASRGGSAEAAGRRVAPAGARIAVGVDGDLVRVEVSVVVRPGGSRLPGFVVTGDAVAELEPS